MALCSRQCGRCGNAVTVRIDYDDQRHASDDLDGVVGRRYLLDLFDSIRDDLAPVAGEVAVILHVSGADIAACCAHAHREAASDIELFG